MARRGFVWIVAVTGLALAGRASSGGSAGVAVLQETKLALPAGVGAGDRFGHAADVHADTLIAGASALPNSHVYVRSGATWTWQAGFGLGGKSVAVYADVAAGGSGGFPCPPAAGSGWCPIYERTGTTWSLSQVIQGFGHDDLGEDVWAGPHPLTGTPVVLIGDPGLQTVFCDDGAGLGYEAPWNPYGNSWFFLLGQNGKERLGQSIASAPGHVVMGATEEFINGRGRLYVYTLVAGSWTERAKLMPNGQNGDRLGESLDMDGGIVIGGAPGHAPNGRAYIYAGQDSTWTLEATLVSPSSATAADFGATVAVRGELAAVGAPRHDQFGTDAGAVFLYRWLGGSWVHVETLRASDTAADDRFGTSLSLDGTTLLVGAPQHDDGASDTGAVYIFELALVDPPQTYCTAKTNSLGCVPQLSFNGCPSASDPNPFDILATQAVNNKSGTFFYSLNGRKAAPFFGGTLCVLGPSKRTGLQTSGGNPPPNDCSGVFTYDFNARIQGGADPTLVPGVRVNGQYWYRDGQSSQSTGLSDAIEFDVLP